METFFVFSISYIQDKKVSEDHDTHNTSLFHFCESDVLDTYNETATFSISGRWQQQRC